MLIYDIINEQTVKTDCNNLKGRVSQMNEEQKVINRNAVVVFNCDVWKDWLMEIIPADFEGDIVIHGKLQSDEDISISGSIFCKGIKAVSIKVAGNLSCEGDIEGNINVGGYLSCEGNINSEDINVGGCLSCEGDIESCDINVGEKLSCGGYINSGDIYVAEDIICEGDIDSWCISAAGDVICGGDIDSYKIDVLNSLEAVVINPNHKTITAKSLKVVRIENSTEICINC